MQRLKLSMQKLPAFQILEVFYFILNVLMLKVDELIFNGAFFSNWAILIYNFHIIN